MGQDVHSSDIVLDVEQIRRWASSLGRHVTSIAIDGARHDVVLSRPAVRAVVYDVLDRWVSTWVERAPLEDSAQEEGDQGRDADRHDEAPQDARGEPATH